MQSLFNVAHADVSSLAVVLAFICVDVGSIEIELDHPVGRQAAFGYVLVVFRGVVRDFHKANCTYKLGCYQTNCAYSTYSCIASG